jgi:hypothetical protein
MRFGQQPNFDRCGLKKKILSKITFFWWSYIENIVKSHTFYRKLMQSSKSPEFYGTHQEELVDKGTEKYTVLMQWKRIPPLQIT